MAVQNSVDTRSTKLVDNFIESVQIGGVIVALRRLNPRPSYVEPDHGEAVLY